MATRRFAHHLLTFEGWAQKNNLPFDLATTFAEIRQAGYEGVEMGGDETKLGKPAALLRLAGDAGLRFAAWGASVTSNPWPPNTESYRRSLDYAAALGVTTIAVCGGFLPEQRRTTFDSDYGLFAENLAAASDHARDNGLTLTFHPHRGCIVETNEEMERLWRHLPGLAVCLDTGHTASVRSSPEELIRAHPGGVRHVHLKDFNVEAGQFTELGHGNVGLDFPAVFGALDKAGYDGWLVVERDNPLVPGAESAAISRRFLAGLPGIALLPS